MRAESRCLCLHYVSVYIFIVLSSHSMHAFHPLLLFCPFCLLSSHLILPLSLWVSKTCITTTMKKKNVEKPRKQSSGTQAHERAEDALFWWDAIRGRECLWRAVRIKESSDGLRKVKSSPSVSFKECPFSSVTSSWLLDSISDSGNWVIPLPPSPANVRGMGRAEVVRLIGSSIYFFFKSCVCGHLANKSLIWRFA